MNIKKHFAQQVVAHRTKNNSHDEQIKSIEFIGGKRRTYACREWFDSIVSRNHSIDLSSLQ
jgi:hypothetical protein